MRSTSIVLALLVACGGGHAKPDAAIEDAEDIDAPEIDAPLNNGIAEARAASGSGLSLAINGVTVTSVRPTLGNVTNDPAGFTIQADKVGPALFVAVDPTAISPPPTVGDVVTFTISEITVTGGQPRATQISDLTVVSHGSDVTPFVQDISSATDLLTAAGDYDAELVGVTGTVAVSPKSSGQGFEQIQLDTAGIQGMPALQVRGPIELMSGIDMTMGCHITVTKAPVIVFKNAAMVNQFEVAVYSASDYTLTGCAAPKLKAAAALSPTSIRLTFDRNILPSSVTGDGSQFTFDNGLTAMAAVVSGRTVTVTTTAQTGATSYNVAVANTVTDLQGTALDGTTLSTTFLGYVMPAVVRINEVNANITNGCDLIELRVVQGGAMTGFRITERNGGTGELNLTFTNFIVQKNDFVIVHSNNSATCNPGTSANETTAVNQQPTATFAANFDTAYDWYAVDNGLTNTNNVITLYDASGAIMDAVFLSDVTSTAAAATLTAAGVVGTASQWMPAQPTYDSATFISAAVDDLNATGAAVAGASIQRINDNDTNAKADWTTGAGATSTWGALNVGQTAFP